MIEHVYETFLSTQLHPAWYLTDEAGGYIYQHLDPDDEAAVRHVLRHLVVPVFEACDGAMRTQVKATLRWFLNCAAEEELKGFIDSDPYWPFEYPGDPRLLYVWWWRELFGDEPWESNEICSAELVRGNPPPGDYGTNNWGPPIDDAVLLFPRRDGLPPGTDAPVVNKPEGATDLPRRPTDGARFFRWQDQANAIQWAEAVHAKSGQYKVWIEFEHAIGEGYLKGGQEYRRTTWACVRFSNGLPVDSFPDLRKGWQEAAPA